MSRETIYSKAGNKLYIVRNKKTGRFKDIQSYKKAHSADLRHTAKGEKRQRLIDYITEFYIMAGETSKSYNKAWNKLWVKIDKLKIV